MLLNDFFSIQRMDTAENAVKAFLLINRDHKIFEGHFPAIPIVPGVCMMQMIREVMEQHLNKKLKIQSGDNMKFLSVINPTVHNEIEADIQYEVRQDGLKINAALYSGVITFFKLKAILQSA